MHQQPTSSATVPQYLRPRHAARHFDIGLSTLWHWIKNRPDFPRPIKAGPRTTLIDIPATAKYLEARSEVQS